MNKFWPSVLEGFARNLVAIISLCVAISAVVLSVERSNRSEYQHNIRDASFRVLAELSQLQLLVDNAHYGRVEVNPIAGWARVNYMRDLASVIPEPVPSSLEQLFESWQVQVEYLGIRQSEEERSSSLKANEKISSSIAEARNAIREVLLSLE
ncbi:hypothetical protein R50073_21960 [Maricurvus nonylphenolicus]|uniref:hypothetical protein n=1 Tax=Maricurvus nonylphenolicus TaxID=1008307 RepID=UPI0036F314EE